MAYNRWLYRNPNLYKVTFQKKKKKSVQGVKNHTIFFFFWNPNIIPYIKRNNLLKYYFGFDDLGICQRLLLSKTVTSLYLSLAQTARFPCSKLPKLTGVGTPSLYLKHPLLYQFPCLLFSLFCEDPFLSFD